MTEDPTKQASILLPIVGTWNRVIWMPEKGGQQGGYRLPYGAVHHAFLVWYGVRKRSGVGAGLPSCLHRLANLFQGTIPLLQQL